MYEAKFDGYRALAIKNDADVRLISRKGHDLTRDYRSVQRAVSELPVRAAVIDGEIVAFDEEGRPSFQQLQHRGGRAGTIRYFAFDLLHLEGTDLLSQPLENRKNQLQKLLRGSGVEFSDELPGTPEQVLHAVAAVGLEGVVAKRRDSRYEPGRRSGVWQKFKLQHRQEFVVGGYKPEGRNFQSLVVGYYEAARLRFAGRVRAGFTPALRIALFDRLKPIEQKACPFADLPTGSASHWGEGVTEQDMLVLKWVKPSLVVEIAFTEWTREGHLRHSSFLGVREDKKPREVVREIR